MTRFRHLAMASGLGLLLASGAMAQGVAEEEVVVAAPAVAPRAAHPVGYRAVPVAPRPGWPGPAGDPGLPAPASAAAG